jgi:hypothetical protein
MTILELQEIWNRLLLIEHIIIDIQGHNKINGFNINEFNIVREEINCIKNKIGLEIPNPCP